MLLMASQGTQPELFLPTQSPFDETLAKIRSTSKFKDTADATRKTGKRAVAKVTVVTEAPQIPLWPERFRGLPHVFARSALFTAANSSNGPREKLTQAEIFSVKGVTIHYTGEELRSDDEDVFLQVSHLARNHPLGQEIEFSAHSLLKSLKWDPCGAGYKRLRDVLTRLTATAVSISADSMERGFAGSLIQSFSWDGSKWTIALDPRVSRLFGTTQYTRLDWEQRLALSPMAKKLHSFYVTHAQPFPMKVETLHSLCNSKIKLLSQFRPALKRTLERLKSIGFLESFSIDKKTDLVTVVRASKSNVQKEKESA